MILRKYLDTILYLPSRFREGIFIFAFKPNNTVMTISIKQDNVTIAVKLEEDDSRMLYEKSPLLRALFL